MRTRQSLLVLALLLIPAAARADRHNWEASASASAASGSELWGGNLSLARTLYIRKSHLFSLFADYSKHGGLHDGASLTQTSAVFGGRFVPFRTLKRYPLLPGVKDPYRYRVQFFVEGALGVVKTSAQDTHGAWLAGGGVDGLFSDYGGVRVQVDYFKFRPDSGRNDFVRVSIGVLYRFEHELPTSKTPKGPKAP
jgi:hypothetical protein